MEAGLDLKKHSRYFFLGTFLLIAIVSIILAWPFHKAIFAAIVLAYLFYPIYNLIKKAFKNETVSAFITTILVLVILALPFIFLGNLMIKESTDLFITIKSLNFEEIGEKYVTTILGESIAQNTDIVNFIKDALNEISLVLLQKIDNFVFTIGEKILLVFVALFVMFYLFKDGKKIMYSIKEALPLKRRYKNEISEKFNNTIYATMYGIVLTAIIQGSVAALGFWFFHVRSPFLWGIIMVILAMIPLIGPAFIWLPAAIIKLSTGSTADGIGLLLYGIFIVSTIDNIIRPKIIGSRSKVHPVLILLGVLGGLKLFGIIGIIIGPLILSILAVFFDIYINEEFEEA